MKRVVIYGILCLLGFAAVPHGELGAQTVRGAEREMPRLTVKTNALYWATASFNAGLEVGLDRRITLEVTGGYNPWTYADNRKFKFWMGSARGSVLALSSVFRALYRCQLHLFRL